jgi:radical SAM superfamily enzyme YgiQ (UPF0313 family)
MPMKVLLCQTYTGPSEPLVFPIGLSYIASSLKDHDLMCWDANVEQQDHLGKLHELLDRFQPDVIGISCRNIDPVVALSIRRKNQSYYPYLVSLVRTVKQTLSASKIVVGGPGFSIFAEDIMKRNPEIDFGVLSEGENTFPEILDNMEHPDKVKGLYIRNSNNVFFTGKGNLVDFTSLPPPLRDPFDVSKYQGKFCSIGIQTKRGCRFKCTYCLQNFFLGEHYRLRPPEKVVDEMEMLKDKYGVESFSFVDPVFNSPPDHGREICKEIIERKLNVKWQACFRPDYLNESYMTEAVKAGCDLFDFSPDGASNEAMQILEKDMDIRNLEKNIECVSKIDGAKVGYNFMYDLPRYNKENISGLVHFFREIPHVCGKKLSYLTLTPMRIYPHTPLYEIAFHEGKINENTDLIFPVYYELKGLRKILSIPPVLLKGIYNLKNYLNTSKSHCLR